MFEEQRFEVISKQKKVRKKGLKIARIEITMLKKKNKKKKNLRIVAFPWSTARLSQAHSAGIAGKSTRFPIGRQKDEKSKECLKGRVCVGTRVECRLVSVARMKKGYYANDPRKSRGREREREEARNALPFARYRIVTRAFTRSTPPRDGRGADLCQSPEERNRWNPYPVREDTQPLSRLPIPKGKEEEEEARLLLFRAYTSDLRRFCPRKRLFKNEIEKASFLLPLCRCEYRCHYESFRCSTDCDVFVLSSVARN